MVAFCRQHAIPHDICGKLVVATTSAEVERLRSLHARGTANGLKGLVWLGKDAMREIEPCVNGLAGLRVPEGIVDYRAVCEALERQNARSGTQLHTSAEVRKVVPDGKGLLIRTKDMGTRVDFVVNCAGLHCDRVAARAGEERVTRIVPFRGEYFKLKSSAQHLVKNLTYPMPDPTFPFLGVHFTRLINGGVEAGPNAVLAFAREGYTKSDIRVGDLTDAVFFPGLWRFLARYRSMAWEEILRSFSKTLFWQSLQRLVPAVQEADLEPAGAGVRAHAMERGGTLVQDFSFIERPNALHVLNAPSPAATASRAIAEEIVGRIPAAA